MTDRSDRRPDQKVISETSNPVTSTPKPEPSSDAETVSNAPQPFNSQRPEAARNLPGSDFCQEEIEIPGYKITEEIGRGGMGVVYKASDLTLNRVVAIKVIKSEGSPSENERSRFLREAKAIASLQHPHIVQIFASGEYESGLYFVMEYVEGANLETRIHRDPQPISTAAHLMVLLARAVQFSHQHSIIHRDLKPGNILLGPSSAEPALNCDYGYPKITDFGLARNLEQDAELTAKGTVLGTASYMAPEQARGDSDQIGPRSDIYSLGAILYKLLTGNPPFKADSMINTLLKVISEPIQPLKKYRDDIPPKLSSICMKCLEKDPGDRYASAEDLAQDLTQFLNKPSMQSPDSKRTGLRRFFQASLAVLGLAVIVLLLRTWQGDEREKRSDVHPPTKPITADFHVRVWTDDKSKQGLSVTDATALPVYNGEKLQLDVELNRAAYIYLLWMDSEGGVWPLYPWNTGSKLNVEDLNGPIPKPAPVKKVLSPPQQDEGWEMEGPRGMETLLLLVKVEPLQDSALLSRVIGKQSSIPFHNPQEVIVMRGTDRQQPGRFTGLKRRPAIEAKKIDDDLLALMKKLKHELQLDEVQAIRFAHADK